MALSLCAEGPKGPRRGAKGSCGRDPLSYQPCRRHHKLEVVQLGQPARDHAREVDLCEDGGSFFASLCFACTGHP